MVRELAMWATAQASVNALSIFGIFCLILYRTRPAERISFKRSVVATQAAFFISQALAAFSVATSLYLHRFTTPETLFRMLVACAGTVYVVYLIMHIRDTITGSVGDEASKEWERVLEQDRMQNRESQRRLLAFNGDRVLQKQRDFMQRANG